MRRSIAVASVVCLSAMGAAPGHTQDLNTVMSFDGTPITFYWFPAAGLTEGQTAPTVLQGPGFGGQAQSNRTRRAARPCLSRDLRRAGLQRADLEPAGISPSGGQAQI
ncbi:MAG: hypothetical protein IPG68_16120 [Micrococcales bacterium]|nr:hypothetical protein [Micrococcales bacterium]